MRKDRKQGFRQWQGKTAAVVLLMMVLSLFWTPGAEAQVFANKGFLFDPGGAPSQMAQPYFVGVKTVDIGNDSFYFAVGVWDYFGNQKYYQQFVEDLPNPNVGNPAFTTGSAVYFNGSLYVLAPYFQNGPYGNLKVLIFDPGTWQPTAQYTLARLYGAEQQYVQKPGIGAVVANGTIYVFLSGSTSRTPVVFTSSDGQNWSFLSTTSPPGNYPTVHDAITFTDPIDGKTKVMVVVSQFASNYYPLLPAVTIFDPATATWGPVSPLPQGALPNGTYGMHASAWFGSWSTTLIEQMMVPLPSQLSFFWNSDNKGAYLHVLGAVWTGSNDYLVHWYLDPATGLWTMDQGVSPWPSGLQGIVPWSGPCFGLNNWTPVALGPGYAKTTASGCTSGDDCLQQQIYGLSCGFFPTPFSYWWMNGSSDLWVPTSAWQGKGTAQPGPWTYNTVDTSNSADPAFGNDPSVYQAMAGLVRINGIIMGPPPFPADPNWQVPADWAQTSLVQLGDSSGTSSGTSSTFNTSVTAGVSASVSVPFVQDKASYSFTYGYSSTHSTQNSFTSSYTWTLGTLVQTLKTLGKQGWMVGHAPIIWPVSYLATSVMDPGPAGTAMGYSQMMLSVGDAYSLFWPFSLTNPSDTSYPMGFLLTGVEPMPASTDVQSWNINQGGAMQDWSDTSKGDWTVVGGASGSGGQFTIDPLPMGSQAIQQFVKSTTKGKDWSNTYTGDYSNSLRLGTKGNNVTTSLDLSAGYETDGSSSTTLQQNMETSYLVPYSQGGYSEIYVQPYLLQAQTYNAPWVPKGYKGPLPWAITWDVTNVSKISSTLGAPDTIYARSLPPKAAAGRITGYGQPNDPPDTPASEASLNLVVNKVRDDFYSITKGRLSYIAPGGTVTPVAMTADEFNPSQGVTVTVNGYKLYANTRKGAWTRSWNIWKYTSISGLEKLKLTLDFGAKTWDMSVSRIELGDRFAGLIDIAAVTLELNGRYLLSTRISHQMAYEWQADLTSFDQPIWVKSINVTKDFAGKGKVKLSGRFTDALKSVGDTSVVLNGEAKHYPLMTKVKNFMKKVMEKGILVYRDDNSSLQANLKSGVWSCQVDTDVFKHPLPFHHGDAQLDLKVGGKDYFKASIHPDSYVMELQYKGK